MIERSRTLPDAPAPSGLEAPRLLGRYDTGAQGPLVIVFGGMHGNEPAGVRAAQRVLGALGAKGVPVAGRLVALAGNRAALRAHERFLARDLNRVWSKADLEDLRVRDPHEDDSEGREQRELLAALEAELDDWHGEPVLLDLHTTSSGGAPFALAADTLQNRRLAEGLPLPLVLGLEEGIEGPLLSYLADRGTPSLVFEGGRHDSQEAEEHLVAALWMFLSTAGLLSTEHHEVSAGEAVLRAATRGAPGLLEIAHVHRIADGDDFRMLEGFSNFDGIEVGQLLAHDRRGPVRAPHRGLMLMPLYQSQGEDGYFLCRGIAAGWLRFSEACRRTGLETLLPSLPGVDVAHGRPRTLRVAPDAPGVVWRVLRHFGYRKVVGEGLLTRRPERGEC